MNTKKKIESIVVKYKKLHNKEYKKFTKVIKKIRDNKLAVVTGSEEIKKQISSIPLTLDDMLVKELELDELNWYESEEGLMWFSKTFKEFNVTNNI